MRILLTGVTGFAGGHLAEALLAKPGMELVGISRLGRRPVQGHKFPTRACDLSQPVNVPAVLGQWRPEQIYHLAGYAHVGRSFGEADAAWQGNLSATRSLLEA